MTASTAQSQTRFNQPPKILARVAVSGLCMILAVGLTVIISVGMARANDVTDGRALYLQYCASCHGQDADGKGPVARALNTPPTNLRLLSDLYGNPLQEDIVAKFIDGRAEVKAHGPRDMPVWGRRFSLTTSGDEAKAKEIIRKLVAYLQSIQTGARTAQK